MSDVRPYVLKGSTYCVATVDKALTLLGNEPYLKDTKNESSAREAVCGEPFASRLLELADGTTKGTHYQRVTMRAKCMAADLLAESLADFDSNTM